MSRTNKLTFPVKNMRTTVSIGLIAVLVAVITWHFLGSSSNTAANKAGAERPVPIQSEVATQQDVPEIISVSGFVTPKNTVDIRSQVMATVAQIKVREGQTVKAGELLFTLDDRGDAANAEKLAAQVVKDQALLDNARRTLARTRDLLAEKFVSQSDIDSAQSNVDAALATLNADRAALAAGRITVDYHQLTAPLSGRVGEINVHIGSLVQPNATVAMTTITQISPIDVAFNVPENSAQQLLSAERNGVVPVTARVGGANIAGRLSFVDNTIDSSAGGLKAKALFDNPEGLLWPGGLVDIDLSLRTIKNAVTVSPRSVQVGPNGQFVYVIAADGTVAAQPVTIDYLTSTVAVLQGLQAGSRVVLEGGQNLRPGVHVLDVKAAPSVSSHSSRAGGAK